MSKAEQVQAAADYRRFMQTHGDANNFFGEGKRPRRWKKWAALVCTVIVLAVWVLSCAGCASSRGAPLPPGYGTDLDPHDGAGLIGIEDAP